MLASDKATSVMTRIGAPSTINKIDDGILCTRRDIFQEPQVAADRSRPPTQPNDSIAIRRSHIGSPVRPRLQTR